MTTETQAADIVELKPCPFCGGAPYGVPQTCWLSDGSPHMYRVLCKECGADPFHRDTPEEAIAAWNTRNSAEITHLRAELEDCE